MIQNKVGEDGNAVAVFSVEDEDFHFGFNGKNFCVDINKIVELHNKSLNATNFEFRIEFDRRMNDADYDILKKIGDSTMLTLFGAEGNPNRLFLSDGSNTIFYSEYRNPFYIGELNTITLGSTPITAWIKGAETSLYVFKKFSRQEESLYVIDGELVVSEDNQFNVDEGEVVFRNKGYNLPESAVNKDCACNLSNDLLVVSDDGVYGVELSSNVASTERFARSRAEQIKNLLQQQDLSKARCIVWDNKMYLAVGGYVFVADARYRASFDGDMSDTFNYEWWFWDNIPVKYWLALNEKLCFITEDNRLCEFYDGFADYIFDSVSVTEIEGDKITISQGYQGYNGIKIDNAYRLTIGTDDIQTITEGGIISSKALLLGEGMEVYFDMISGDASNYPFTIGTPYVVKDVDTFAGKIEFATADGAPLEFTTSMQQYLELNKFRISRKAEDIFYVKITNKESDNATVYETKQDYDKNQNPVVFIAYNSQSNHTATVYKWNSVVAEWSTGSYDFGSSLNAKTIEKFSVSFDRSSSKSLKLYYTTANRGFPNLLKDLKKQNDFDLENISFLIFSFDQNFETSYTKNFLIKNFNYIAFKIVSDEEEDFSINSLSFVYKINKINRGEL